MGFINKMHMRDFIPSLTDEDYFSRRCTSQEQVFSFRGANFTLHGSGAIPVSHGSYGKCASPEEAVSARSLTVIQDGFQQDSPESQLIL
jgi:hypothetical protein